MFLGGPTKRGVLGPSLLQTILFEASAEKGFFDVDDLGIMKLEMGNLGKWRYTFFYIGNSVSLQPEILAKN